MPRQRAACLCTTPQLGGSRPPSATRRVAILGQIVLLSCKFIAACEDFFRLTAQVIHRRPIIGYGNSINFALSNRHSFQFSCLSRVFSGPTDKRFSPQNTPMKRKGEELKRESRRRLPLKFGLCVVPVLSAPSALSAVKTFGCGCAALGKKRCCARVFVNRRNLDV